jgi:hypothetical protein
MSIRRKNFRNILTATIVVALGISAAQGTVYAEQSGDKAKVEGQSMSVGKSTPPSQLGTRERSATGEVPVFMTVPTQQSDRLAMEKGCWVKLYDKKDFNGDSLLLIGPLNLARLIGPFGFDWENRVRSLQTGPNANLTIFDNRNFKDEDKFIDPNRQIPNLSEKMGLFNDFRSMILACV